MIIGYILLAIALVALIIGLRFVFVYNHSQSTIFYGLLAIGVAIYVGINGAGYIGALVGPQVVRWGWVGATIATVFFLAFSYSFPLPKKLYRELLPWWLWPTLIFLPAFIFTELLTVNNNTLTYPQGYVRQDGPYIWVFLIFFAIYWLWALWIMINRFRVADGIHRWQLRLILIGSICSLVVATLFDIIIPESGGTGSGYVGPFFTSIWLGFTSYILLKK